MAQNLSETSIKEQYELYNRLKNDTRKKLLTYLYEQPRNYKELADYTGLKPGSLYHHLGVLEPLIEKYDHGQYKITELGTKIIASLDLVSSDNQKPKIQSSRAENNQNEEEKPARPQIIDMVDNNSITSDEQKEITHSVDTLTDHDVGSLNRLLTLIWLSPTSYILLTISFFVMLLLGMEGVAFAGSAIYAVGNSNAFLVDLLSIVLGIGTLLVIEELLQEFPIYDRLKFIIIIRVISMLPSLIIGITLLLLFMTGIVPPPGIYPVIFAIGIFMGTMVMATGIHYLRAQPLSDAILYSVIPISVDLLIGVVILLSV